MVTATLAAFLALAPSQTVDRSFLPTGVRLRPVGRSVEFGGRPVGLVRLSAELIAVKDKDHLRILDATSWREAGRIGLPGGASPTGIVRLSDGRVAVTSATDQLHLFRIEGTNPVLDRSIKLPGPDGKGNSYPSELAVLPNGRLLVCLSRNNSVAEVDLSTGTIVRQIAVDIAPYGIAVSADGQRAWVSNQGGRMSRAGEKTATSAGTPAPVDDRGIVKTGTVTCLDVAGGRRLWTTSVGLQPTDVLPMERRGVVLVACANADTVAGLDPTTGRQVFSVPVKPDNRLPFGSMPNALAADPDGRTVYVALAGNNAVAVLDLAQTRQPKVRGFLPTGWFPSALMTDGRQLIVANMKGVGSRQRLRPEAEGWNSHDHAGTVQSIPATELARLAEHTRTVREDAHIPQVLRAFARRTGTKAKPVPVPGRLGDPSQIEHVVYVIKENRTYDQVFGDIKTAKGDPRLCVYPERTTPNHHALAREFVLLDNYYCNGVLSADGHSWATEGNVTPYLERAFGGFNRSYTFGDDPLTYSSTGFLWDRVLGVGLSFRNYGEMDYAEPPKGMKLRDILAARAKGQRLTYKHSIGIERLRRYSNPDFPGWNMEIPDVERMDHFLREFREFERRGTFPNLTIVYLPQDHVGGSVSSRSHMADNDLAIGQLVQAVSKSKFWPKTAIFINEDDPQGGFDHVDGHRSLCLVVSPYTRNRGKVSEFYNQTSVLHTMLRILGCPPLNQRDAGSPLMTACFRPTPDLRPYRLRPNNVPLDEPIGTRSQRLLARVPLSRPGLKTPKDDETLNRVIWHEAKGWGTPYPVHLAGPHGRGLKGRGLRHDEKGDED